MIQYLTKYKAVENDGIEKQGSIVMFIEHENLFATKFEKQKDDNLIDALTNYIPPHDPGDEFRVFSDRWPLHQAIMRRFCSQCQRAESVHDHVYPKHLDSTERSRA